MMTNFEQRQLADIERRLITESPELDQILTGEARRQSAMQRRRWRCAAAVTALISVVLVCVGVGLGLTAVAVTAACPPVTYLVLRLGASVLNRRARKRRGA